MLAKVNNPRWRQNVPQLWCHTNYCINEFFSALHEEDHYVPCGGADRLLVCVCAALDTGRTGDCCCCWSWGMWTAAVNLSECVYVHVYVCTHVYVCVCVCVCVRERERVTVTFLDRRAKVSNCSPSSWSAPCILAFFAGGGSSPVRWEKVTIPQLVCYSHDNRHFLHKARSGGLMCLISPLGMTSDEEDYSCTCSIRISYWHVQTLALVYNCQYDCLCVCVWEEGGEGDICPLSLQSGDYTLFYIWSCSHRLNCILIIT